jgi:predicted NAD/FAD-binding protein
MRIAIIGSGVAGMTAAYRLNPAHDITVFEASDHFGGHTYTRDIEMAGRHYAVDMGFIVFNDRTYPSFVALMNELGVEWQNSNMSFSLRCERTGLEYNGTSLNSLFAQRMNFVRPSFLRMIADILRFNSESPRLLLSHDTPLTLGEYLAEHGYSRPFIERYIVPMGRAIWSATEEAMLNWPARFFVDFFERHGFLTVNNRPQWKAIRGGSREYARKLTASYRQRIRLRTPVQSVKRAHDAVIVRTARGDVERFDYVVFACHSDQALAMLEKPTPQESEILGAFPYQPNEVVLHTDTTMLPRTPLARAAWNYHALAERQDAVALTYDMNILQTLVSPKPFLVTLNRTGDIDPKKIIHSVVLDHPVYTPAAVAAQKRRHEVSGRNRTFYCGAYWRYGFHEDGVVSAEWAVRDFNIVSAREQTLRGLRPAWAVQAS